MTARMIEVIGPTKIRKISQRSTPIVMIATTSVVTETATVIDVGIASEMLAGTASTITIATTASLASGTTSARNAKSAKPAIVVGAKTSTRRIYAVSANGKDNVSGNASTIA